jgi:hypothetical protein
MIRAACTIWLGLLCQAGLDAASAADPENQDGPRPEAKPEAAAPAEAQQPPLLPALPLEPPGGADPAPGLEVQPPALPPDEPASDDLRLAPLGPPGGAVPPGELGPGPPGGPDGLMRGPSTDFLAGLSRLEADEAAQRELLASVEHSQHRLAALGDQLLDLRQQLRDARRAIVEARGQGDYGKSAQLVAMLDAKDHLVQAELDATKRHTERVEILERHVASMRKVRQRAVQAVADGRASELDRLRATAARLDAEIRLHTEQHPATTPEQLELLHGRVGVGQLLFNRVFALYKVGAPGGQADRCCLAAKNLAQWRAELEFARGEYDEALKYQRMARDAARQAVEAAQAAYDMGTVTLDVVLQAQTDLLAVEMKLIEWEARYGEGPPPSGDGQPPPAPDSLPPPVPLPTPEPSPRPVLPTPGT